MATGGLYGNSGTGALVATPGAESSGLYGNSTNFGGTYFEWFIFQVSDTQPATPTGGSWSFSTNTGTAPSGWTSTPPANPTNTVWVSISIVTSRNTTSLTWSVPGKFSFSSGLPILSGSGAPLSGDGQTDQLYIQLDTTPQTIWFKETGTWTRLTGSTLYADLTSNQTIAGTKTFSSQIQGSISGNAANVTGTVAITNGGTGSTTAGSARAALGAAASGANSDITSLTGLTTALSLTQGGTGATTASDARTNLGLGSAAVLTAGAANGVATLDAGGTVPLSQIPASIQGGVSYQGTWNATTNTPTLTSSVGTKGYYYVVSVAGSTDLNGITSWNIGDWAIFNGTAWEKIDNTDAVTSVNGYTGTVVLNANDVGALSNITSTDGSVTITTPSTGVRNLSVAVAAATNNVIAQVRNATGATLTKGTVVYITGATGQISTVSKALANADATSAQTLGMITADLPNNTNGNVTIIGLISNIDTSAYTDGAQLYLSPTVAGAVTTTKPYAPQHLVYVGIVEYAHPTQGKIFVKVQNGYELDELHDVAAQSPTNGQTIVYNSTTNLWEKSFAPVISGTTINNTTIGATTASTGAFTTLTTSSTVTHNGGTANGVTYLNGSKVLTTGSALVFDGTNLGVGVTPSAWSTLRGFDIGTTGSLSSHSSGATDSAFVSGNAYFNGTNWIYKATSTATQYKMYGGVHSWYTAPSGTAGNAISFTQAMTLDVSGNLGIGTSSPTSKLVVGDNATTTAKPTVAITDTTSGASIALRGQSPILSFDVTSAGVPKILMDGAGIEFKTGTLDAQGDVDLKIDSSGNVGIGTSSPGSLLQVEGAISMRGVADVRLTLGSAGSVNANTSNYIRAATDLLIYNTASGRHAWEIGGTERMRIDSSGNVLVGATANSGYKFEVTATTDVARFIATDAGASGSQIDLLHDSASPANNDVTGLINFSGRDSAAQLTTYSRISGISTNVTNNSESGAIAFSTRNTGTFAERMRIASNGTLNVNRTSGGGTVNIKSQTNNFISEFYHYSNDASVGSITTSTTATTYGTSSDYRLKNVVGPVTDAGERIDALEPVEYEWKSDGSRTRGFLAHQFQEVYAGSVTGSKDAVDAEGNPVYQSMQASTSEVIADLVAEIKSLRARVAALEGQA